jgi:hypothetical protein
MGRGTDRKKTKRKERETQGVRDGRRVESGVELPATSFYYIGLHAASLTLGLTGAALVAMTIRSFFVM